MGFRGLTCRPLPRPRVVLLWEVTRHDPGRLFAEVPADYFPGYQYFNIPADVTRGSGKNPLQVLKAVAKPEARIPGLGAGAMKRPEMDLGQCPFHAGLCCPQGGHRQLAS